MTIEEALDELPPIQPGLAKTSYRQFQLRIPTQIFLQLEIEAAKRGMTSYKLGSTILGMYLTGKLQLVKTPETKTNNDGQG